MLETLRSPLLAREGFAHAFSLRTGGVSEPPFDTLNLARVVGDDPLAVAENYRRFVEVLGVPVERFFETTQVHGAVVKIVRADDRVEPTRALEADALSTAVPGIGVGVRVADCVPILLADPETGAVAAVHAGWRGCVERVLDRALDALGVDGASAPRIVAAIGPHIGPAAFEVGDEVAETIAASADPSVLVRGYDKPHVDLERVVRIQLRSRGLAEERIERVPGCTFEEPARFHSYRRDGKRSGRHVGAIVARVGSARAPW